MHAFFVNIFWFVYKSIEKSQFIGKYKNREVSLICCDRCDTIDSRERFRRQVKSIF